MSKIGVTNYVESIFPYERNRWTHFKKYEDFNAQKSKKLHSDIELYLKNNEIPFRYPEFNSFLRLINNEKLIHISSEITIENEKFIGKYDSLFEKNGKLILIDWKSVGEIDTIGYGTSYYEEIAISDRRANNYNFLNKKYANCNYNKYGLQLMIYSEILKESGLNIGELWIVNLKFDKYYIYKVDNLLESKYENFNKYIIPFGKHKGKKLNQLTAGELDFMCCATVFNDTENTVNVSNSVFYKIEGEMKHLLNYDNASMLNIIKNLFNSNFPDNLLKSRIYAILNSPETINMARQYADSHKLCIGCYKNKCVSSNDYLCIICIG